MIAEELALAVLLLPFYATASYCGEAEIPWVLIKGGVFDMGSDEGQTNTKPAHRVAMRSYFISRTDVTVGQYDECVRAGKCTQPGTGPSCNWRKSNRENHPINCVTWNQAVAYAKFAGARLPSEAEWEYAARSGGLNEKYPWGEAAPDCERAVMFYSGDSRCDDRTTRPVCSRPLGNTRQGLCDMIGNVLQWVEDSSYDNYDGAPANGSAREGNRPYRVIRGGAFFIAGAWFLQSFSRSRAPAGDRGPYLGFRLAKNAR